MALGVWRDLHDAFVIELDVQEIVAENDRVTVRYTERGRYRRRQDPPALGDTRLCRDSAAD
ncbi:MAG TPA: hypothetical protein VIT18_10100 [Terrimicrobiaceae bacterium]